LDFPLRQRVQTDSGIHPISYSVSTGDLFTGIKRSEHEADHSRVSNAEVKMLGVLPSLPHSSSWCHASGQAQLYFLLKHIAYLMRKKVTPSKNLQNQ